MRISLIRSLPGAGLIPLVTLITGCAGSAITQTPPSVPGEVQVVDSQPMEPSPPPRVPQTGDPASAPSTAVPIEQQFIIAANQAQAQQDWSTAIEQAERGLRVNRRQPELYLILAQSYWQLGESAQASQFARQGLRYLGPGSEVLQLNLRKLAYPNNAN
ncbi:tetratricopeptide repeat protein [Halioxenophilus aromaticivorans]|uniref:Tetratricopeptide repeat protein n=1 Tax=Halioxenophilus aromaticivorans TaxID=1306992 RepID=A0AAV3U9P7_9ALTE